MPTFTGQHGTFTVSLKFREEYFRQGNKTFMMMQILSLRLPTQHEWYECSQIFWKHEAKISEQ